MQSALDRHRAILLMALASLYRHGDVPSFNDGHGVDVEYNPLLSV